MLTDCGHFFHFSKINVIYVYIKDFNMHIPLISDQTKKTQIRAHQKSKIKYENELSQQNNIFRLYICPKKWLIPVNDQKIATF